MHQPPLRLMGFSENIFHKQSPEKKHIHPCFSELLLEGALSQSTMAVIFSVGYQHMTMNKRIITPISHIGTTEEVG